MIKVSIIIPIYNVEKYIEECLESVVNQKCSALFECILVDDCGRDNSVVKAERFIDQYKGSICFKMLHHEQNKGLSAARNTGIREAKGEYVYFLDSDDRFYEDESLSKLLKVADTYPDAEIVQGEMTGVGLSLNHLDLSYSNDREWVRQALCTVLIPDPACNKLTKREFIVKNNIFFAEGYYQEDTIWQYQIQKYILAIALCHELTYWYRYNPEGIMKGKGAEWEAKSFARVFRYAYDDLMKGEKIEPCEIRYLMWNAKRVFGYVGKAEGKKLLVTQNNPLFNRALVWSTSLTRVHVKWLRKILLWVIRLFILEPTIKKLCKKENLGRNYVEVC